MCDYCNTNSNDYKYKTVPFNFGDLGDYELRFGISPRCGAIIEMAEESRADPVLGCEISLNYCPYCGENSRRRRKMPKFTLVGVDGNAFSVVGYTSMAMKRARLEDQIDQMRKEAMSGDYNNLLYVCKNYIDKVNKVLGYAE